MRRRAFGERQNFATREANESRRNLCVSTFRKPPRTPKFNVGRMKDPPAKRQNDRNSVIHLFGRMVRTANIDIGGSGGRSSHPKAACRQSAAIASCEILSFTCLPSFTCGVVSGLLLPACVLKIVLWDRGSLQPSHFSWGRHGGFAAQELVLRVLRAQTRHPQRSQKQPGDASPPPPSCHLGARLPLARQMPPY